MPAKPSWLSKLPAAITQLRAAPSPFVSTETLALLLGVGRRRAQQLLQPCVSTLIGSSGLADRGQLVEYLERLAASETNHYEQRRRVRLARVLGKLREDAIERPRVLVEAPTRIIDQRLDALPQGVDIRPGEIVVRASSDIDALEKLLALAMAIGNDGTTFARLITGQCTDTSR